MCAKSWTLVLASTLFLPFILSSSSASTICDASLYGNPDPSNCSQILLDNRAKGTRGLESKDRTYHLFYTGKIEIRPSDVTVKEWWNRVNLAMTISNDGCNIFLVPGYDANGIVLYDTGTYSSIAKRASKVQNYCSHFPAPGEDQTPSMEGGQGWVGDKGHLLAILYSNTSAFATTLAENVAKGYAKNDLADFSVISARNPPNIPKPEPTCGRSHFCTRASHCRGALACICVADRWYGEYYYSTCKYPLPGGRNGRGLLEFDSANATQVASSINETFTVVESEDSACPCNCTYVSRACCSSLSGTVYEAPELRLGALQASSEKVTCNATTGDFQASNMPLDVTLTPREMGRK